ncbi:FAD-binding oxidoreductase [Alsobacter sp. SYSU BS001988]|jgi:NAD(P)H-flavin reductase/ferredoxin
MSSKCQLTINGRSVSALVGATVLDAALAARIAMPHDCCTGQCDSCRVSVEGGVDDHGTREGATVLGCQATLTGHASITFEEAPAVGARMASVSSIRPLSPDIDEVTVELNSPLRYLPGQYVKLSFKGLPERDYSPTVGLGGEADVNRLYFHVRRYPMGRFSSAIGQTIKVGSRLKVRGPYGHAWLRQGTGPLVLVASGTGFAPIWSIAVAARLGQPDRPITVIAGARNPADLYMRQAFAWLSARGVRDLALTTSGGPAFADMRAGRPTDALPALGPDHTVYAAGAPAMVAAVKRMAQDAGAVCYADPFVMNETPASLTQKLGRFFQMTNWGSRPGEPGAAATPRPLRSGTI